ncbi:MAG: prolipoprotein diacylglyceryl transferase [Bacilli bacterium]|nr:prolipoprotein diacylglyceryl transferase [Bacilli bacterium]
MFPDIKIFDKVISWYSIMAIIGIIVSGWYTIRVCKKKKIDDNQVIIILLIAAIGVLIGSHILYGLTKFDFLIKFIKNFHKIDSFKLFFDCIIEIFGGSVFYGGLIGGLISAYSYMKIKKIDIQFFSDLLTPVIPLFHIFGRIGCFLSGCCYGIESKIGFTYKYSLMELSNHVNRFPIQLVEASYNLILFIVLTVFYNKGKFKGKLLYIYLILYPIGRFIFEFFRGDYYRGFIFGISTSQFISILLLIFSVIMLLIKRKKADR